MDKLLNVDNIRTTFRNDRKENVVVDGVSYYLRPGEIVGLVGE